MRITLKCPYCGKNAKMVSGQSIYPYRRDLFEKTFYLCEPCKAYVGCHPGTQKPLGRLADAALRAGKREAHAAFDPIWKEGYMRRGQAYAWLGKELELPAPHIGEMDLQQCQKTKEISLNYLSSVRASD